MPCHVPIHRTPFLGSQAQKSLGANGDPTNAWWDSIAPNRPGVGREA